MFRPAAGSAQPPEPQHRLREIALVKSLLDSPIAFHRPLVRVTGSVTAALFLSQLMYWSPRGKDPAGWIYKRVEERTEETGLSRDEQQTVRKRLVQLGVLEEQRRGIPYRLYYRLNLQQLADLLAAPAIRRERRQLVDRNPVGHWTGKPSAITETTSETSSKTTEATGTRAVPERPDVSNVSKKHSEKHSAANEKKPERDGGVEAAVAVPTGSARRPADPATKPASASLVAGFDLLWAAIPKRISRGTAKLDAWEVWKSLKPTPSRRHVAEMVNLLTAYIDEETDYAFYEADGTVKVTPAILIGLLCRAMNEGSPLRKVVDEDVL